MIDADSELEIDSRLDSVAPRDATARAARDARDGQHRHARRGPSRPNRTSEDTRRAHERASRSRCEQAVLGQRELYVYWKTHDLTAALATAKVSTTETTNTLGIVRQAKIDFHPNVFSLAVGYKF